MFLIFASKVASLSGNHRYQKQSEALRELWEKCDPESYRAALDRSNVVVVSPEDELVEKGIAVEINSMIRRMTVNIANESEAQIADSIVEIKQVAQKYKLSGDTAESLVSTVMCQKGIVSESKIMASHVRDTGSRVTEQNTRCRYMTVCSSDGVVICKLCGKTDGVDYDNKQVVEIKKRMNRLFEFIPVYEKVQLHCYMQLTGFTKALLIQEYSGERSETYMAFDSAFWDSVVVRLQSGLKLVQKAIEGDEPSQDKILATPKA